MYKRIVVVIVLIFFFFRTSHAAKDSIPVAYEKASSIAERSFDAKQIDEAKADRDFQYNIEPVKNTSPNWLDKLMYRIMKFIANLFFNPTGSIDSILFYIICIALVVLLVILIMRMNKVGMFSKTSTKTDPLYIDELNEDINSLDFDKMIEEAVQHNMYRRAVRLYYLKALKNLSDKNFIAWEIDKTNREYLYELKTQTLRNGFENITYLYEYVWYGEMDLDAEKFKLVQSSFANFSTLTASER